MHSALRRYPVAVCFLVCLSLAGKTVSAQSVTSASARDFLAQHPALSIPAQANRVPASPNLALRTQLSGHVPTWATPARQVAQSVDLSASLQVSLVLQRSPAVQAAFEKFLADQQDTSSPLYHQWLTPQQVGDLYGPTQSDLDAVTTWAASEGLTVTSVAPNRLSVDLSGTTAQVANALRTNFGYFTHYGSPSISATIEPSIPAALVPLIGAIHGLSERKLQPHSHKMTQALQPQTNLSDGTHVLLPNDFATIYDITSVYSGGNKGATIGSATQHVAIIGRSRVATADITAYETLAGISTSVQPIVVLAGADPGVTNDGDQDEATLDVDRVIGTAPGAQTDLVVSASTRTTDGVDIAIQYNINTLKDPVMTVSFGSCEQQDGQSDVNFYNNEFSTAAAEGMSVFVSSGDAGAAGCDTGNAKPPASQVASINTLCSSGYVTCVGGTEFNDSTNSSTYWSTTNSSSGEESALSYIPEGGWNEPTETSTSGTTTTTTYIASATGGGASVYVTKPSWQTGTGVPADGFRDVPDVAFSAATHDGYVACLAYSGTDCSKYIAVFGGTSAAAPGMAGVAALLNTKLGAAQGNINPLLYKLASTAPTSFHDATVTTSGVSGCTTASPSMCNNSTPSPTGLTGGLAGFQLTTGFDEVTGLGSLDVANFLAAAANLPGTTSLAVASSANPAITNQAVTLTATLTNSTSSNTPTGTVQFYSNGTAIGSATTLISGSASISYTFTTAGTVAITAVYSGDSHFSSSTSPATSLIVNPPGFTVTAATNPLNVISGSVTGNTDTINVQSSTAAGTVTVACTVTSVSGSAAGTCSLSTPVVVLTPGSSGSTLLSVSTTPGTSGTLSISVTGTNGAAVVTSLPIVVNVTAPSFTVTASPTTVGIASGASTNSNITLTSVNGFAGTVALTCSTAAVSSTVSAAGTCTVAPTSVVLTANGTATATATIATNAGTSGSLTATVTGAGKTTGSSITATNAVSITVTENPPFTMAAGTASLSVTRGATTANTDTITVTSVGSFTGAVALTCTATLTSGTVSLAPTCTMSPASVTPTAGGTATSAATITTQAASTTCTSSAVSPSSPWGMGAPVFAAFTLALIPFRRRKAVRNLLMIFVLVGGLTWLSGCGGSGGGSVTVPCSVTSQTGTTTGSYVVLVTGKYSPSSTGPATIVTTSFALTVN